MVELVKAEIEGLLCCSDMGGLSSPTHWKMLLRHVRTANETQ